ncbi:hypothetical protein ACYZTL_21185 [Pseudomonas sp. LB3P81]
MGRKRIKPDVEQELLLEQSQQRFDFRDEDGLFPFSNVFRWRPQNGKAKGKVVSLTLDAQMATEKELSIKGENKFRFFYSEFREQYPWAVRALARGLKTMCLSRRISHPEASYGRYSIGAFFQYCRDESIALDSFEDLNFQLLCRWRNSLRFVGQDSRYKSVVFRRFCKILESLMGTTEFPVKFAVPVYKSDAPDQLPPYSDAVMYQLVVAATADIDNIMNQNAGHYPGILNGVLDEPSTVACLGGSTDFILSSELDKKQIPSRETLFPFFLFFIICSGANKETACTWKRTYEVGGKLVSPLDWKDPFDPMKCRLRGMKFRGKGKLLYGIEDFWVEISDEGIYPVLKFLLWYTEPLSELADDKLKYNLWLYKSQNKKGVYDYYEHDVFFEAARAFLSKNEIWDMQFGNDGELQKKRITSLDSRRFRKVYTAKELLKAIKECQNSQELVSQLQGALHHASFDTTLASYMSLGKSKDIIDLGIFTLQTEMVAEARKFRGVRDELHQSEGRPGIYTACADPIHPDYEGAYVEEGTECGEYDMCLGCTQSRVFKVHLPRIAMRILQYEDFRESMPRDAWEAEFGRKIARAYDVLNGWSDQDQVEEAWQRARAGSIHLPKIIVRS